MLESTNSHKKLLENLFQLPAKNPDEYFRELDSILLPIQGETFENEAISVARLIGRKFGARITLLHVGSKEMTPIKEVFKIAKVKTTAIIESRGDPHELILSELQSQPYQLLIMPSRRRPRWRYRFSFNSISAKVIPKSSCDVLQIYHRHPDNIDDKGFKLYEFSKIAALLPGSIRDLNLLYYANSLLTTPNAIMRAYYFGKLPYITPAIDATKSDLYDEEKEKFQTIIDSYSMFFGTHINGEFVVTRNLDRGAANFLNQNHRRPDIVFFGQTKHRRWYELRTLSDKFIDRIIPAVAVHHHSGKENPKNSS